MVGVREKQTNSPVGLHKLFTSITHRRNKCQHFGRAQVLNTINQENIFAFFALFRLIFGVTVNTFASPVIRVIVVPLLLLFDFPTNRHTVFLAADWRWRRTRSRPPRTKANTATEARRRRRTPLYWTRRTTCWPTRWPRWTTKCTPAGLRYSVSARLATRPRPPAPPQPTTTAIILSVRRPEIRFPGLTGAVVPRGSRASRSAREPPRQTV